ncbi:MAG: hypothetical protein Ta2G_20530 [Termitinemataceae bacterium]|nr:MAG: hypothetical protein Ta2G_20530 [Termitinemataceae bacterium]
MDALKSLNGESKVSVGSLSKIYKTDPVGYKNQDFFLNMVCSIQTDLDPYQLLDLLHRIENSLQRKRTIRFGPRTIDLDILLYDDIKLLDPLLTIPHPRMADRAFVMVPLRDVHHDKTFNGKSFDEIISSCADFNGLEFYKEI